MIKYCVFFRTLNINQMNQSEETKNTPSPATQVRDVSKYTCWISSNQSTVLKCCHTAKLTVIVCFSLLSNRSMRSLVAVQEVQVWMVKRTVPHQPFHNLHEWVNLNDLEYFGIALLNYMFFWWSSDGCWHLDVVDVLTVVWGNVQVSLTLEEKQRLAKEQEQAAKLRSQQPLAPQSVKPATTTPQVTHTLCRGIMGNLLSLSHMEFIFAVKLLDLIFRCKVKYLIFTLAFTLYYLSLYLYRKCWSCMSPQNVQSSKNNHNNNSMSFIKIISHMSVLLLI